ncbi:hypothetical protein BKA62DRAFT_32144 [Auriculariales sp. MPI-PUGE-AT-0066]|nr:hypothetical protein BKA62DRAFT_32144 [Auriculariales sp. MPI-PUGE-AT-0066]
MEVAEIIVEARNELRNDVPDWHYCCIFAGIGPAEGRTRWLFEFEMPNDLLMDTFWEVMNKEYGYHPDGFEIGDVLVLSDVGRERFLCRIQELTDTSCDLAMPPSQADTRSLRASVLPASPSDPSSSTVDLSSTRDQAAQPVAGPSRISSLISNNHQRDRPTRAIGNNVDEDFDNSDAFMRIRRKTGPSESHKASTQPISTGREPRTTAAK